MEGNYSGYCSQGNESEEAKHKQEHEFKAELTGNELRERMFEEIEAVDPDNISSNISSLSLGMDPGELPVLREIWESNFIGGQSDAERPPIPSLQSMCDHLMDNMTCPTCHSRPKDKARHMIVSQGCESYPFPWSRDTWPLNGENSINNKQK